MGTRDTPEGEATAAFFERLRIPGDPVADPAAEVRVGNNARFTVLTPRLLRLEWSPDGGFEDRATYAFPNRRASVPPFASHTDGDTVIVDTGALVLRHTPDGRPLHAGNISIELTGHPHTRWVPGTHDPHNLGGARRTVDGCRGDAALEPGLVSRSGWAVVDDSVGVVFEPDGWVAARPVRENLQDWYFFGYGHDYPAALSDYTRFGGRIPMVPRWVLGAWWSRYWPYRDADLRELVAEFRAHDLPLDVLVLDMDWHTTDSWTGYTWNRELFPDPPGFLDWLHREGLHTTLNLHPALGVQPFEDAYPAFAAAMGLDPASGEPVPFRIADKAFVRNYFELLHHPLEDSGVDFWWIDWQQGRASELPGLDPLPWLNHLHFADSGRRADRRALVFSRWGGLGSHRYPIGFSGDSYALWPMLRFQPRYTAAGANVGYGWWSHDIGGHVGNPEPELYARWVQFGAFSPVLRPHSTEAGNGERLPWKFGDEVLAVARDAYRMRYQLIPYLYTAARIASDTGAAMVRPTAWVAPEQDGAYLARYQYLLGDALLVAPVVHPRGPTGLAPVDVWLPAGDWIERTTGEGFTGPRWVRLLADLARVPQFVRAGTVLPLAEVSRSTMDQPADHLMLSVFPGAAGSARVYEDDGTSNGYLAGRYAWTTVTTSAAYPAQCTVVVEPAVGELVAEPRRYTVRFEGTRPPVEVTVDGSAHDGWHHDADRMATVVEVPHVSRDRGVTVTIRADGPLSAWGPSHDAALRDADLRRLLGDDTLPDDTLAAAVRALPAGHPSFAAAVARLGGPAVQVFEYTAPDEAVDVLGRVVVGAASTGPAARAEAVWMLDRGGAVRTATSGPVEVAGDAAVFDSPFRWDGSATPTRWSVRVTVTWGDLVVEHLHESAILIPALPSWRAAVVEAADDPGPEKVLADLDLAEPELDWMLWQADPGGIDFPSLDQQYVLPLWESADKRPGTLLVSYAATLVTVPDDREVAFSYHSSVPVTVHVDGQPIEPDVTGNDLVPWYVPQPWSRRTAPVHLTAGTHTVLFASANTSETQGWAWYLSVTAGTPAGHPLLDITSAAPPVPTPNESPGSAKPGVPSSGGRPGLTSAT